jgi:hypothetical protein
MRFMFEGEAYELAAGEVRILSALAKKGTALGLEMIRHALAADRVHAAIERAIGIAPRDWLASGGWLIELSDARDELIVQIPDDFSYETAGTVSISKVDAVIDAVVALGWTVEGFDAARGFDRWRFTR